METCVCHSRSGLARLVGLFALVRMCTRKQKDSWKRRQGRRTYCFFLSLSFFFLFFFLSSCCFGCVVADERIKERSFFSSFFVLLGSFLRSLFHVFGFYIFRVIVSTLLSFVGGRGGGGFRVFGVWIDAGSRWYTACMFTLVSRCLLSGSVGRIYDFLRFS